MSEELVSQLEAQSKYTRENPSTIKDTVSATLRELMTEENLGKELNFDKDATKLVDFIAKTLRNHAIKSAGKNTFRFSSYLMGLSMNHYLQGPTVCVRNVQAPTVSRKQ